MHYYMWLGYCGHHNVLLHKANIFCPENHTICLLHLLHIFEHVCHETFTMAMNTVISDPMGAV